MARPKKISLLQGHRKAIGFGKEALPQPDSNAGRPAIPDQPIEVLLKDIPAHIVKKAWFTLSHILPESGATIVDSGCNTGEM
ncbi:MAG TPA: hypothetical protein PLK94_12220, partial [Alphaproteobacteria bacterium]|nr:hypothetical protein [Alphaproteobacteria bacterium]